MSSNENFAKLRELVQKQRNIIKEMQNLFIELRKATSEDEKILIPKQIELLKKELKKENNNFKEELEWVSLIKLLEKKEIIKEAIPEKKQKQYLFTGKAKIDEFKLSDLERLTLKRLKKYKKEKKEKGLQKPNPYIQISNKLFSKISNNLSKEQFFNKLHRDLARTNLQVLTSSYISAMLLSILISLVIAIFIVIFFLFFNFGVTPPFFTISQEAIGIRLAKTFWMIFLFPIFTFLILYIYPGLEKKTAKILIDQELPFATIHMSAISGAMIEPTKIFSILVSTGDYPEISKQFTKLLNQINFHGYSLVEALRITSRNSPSEKLAELLNGLATTITSGGDLPNFFDKRAESLLLDYKLDKEKHAKSAETFMDIYISVVIAAPMIFMLLLIMMSISGLGVGFSAGIISLIMSLGVAMINILFLVFLHIKGGTQGE